jgi:hypothetical protein
MQGQTSRAENSVTLAARFSVFIAQLTPTVKAFFAGRSSAEEAACIG